MNKITAAVLVGVMAVSLSTGVSAQQVKPEDQIKYRKAAYSFASWNMTKIKANIDGTYNAAQVKAAANAIAAVAGSGLGALYGPGTDKAVGGQKTAVKPELFLKENGPEVGRLAGDFATASAALVQAAESGDIAKIKAAHGKVGETCKACHDKFKSRN